MTQATLRPVGELLGESFGRLKGRIVTLSMLFVFGIILMLLSVVLVYALGIVFLGFIQGWDVLGKMIQNPHRIPYALDQSRGALTVFNLLAAFIALRVYCWVMLATVHASMDQSLGFRGALRKGKGRGYAFLVLVILQQILLQVGMVLFILPGLVLAVLLGFALYVFARENAGVFESLGSSVRIVKGHFFGVLGRMILLALIGGLIMIVPVLGVFAGMAWVMVAWAVIYEDLRVSLVKQRVPQQPRVMRPAPAGSAPAL